MTCAGQARFAGMSAVVVGLELAPVLKIAEANGVRANLAADLAAAAEAGFVEAMAEAREKGED